MSRARVHLADDYEAKMDLVDPEESLANTALFEKQQECRCYLNFLLGCSALLDSQASLADHERQLCHLESVAPE